MGRAMKHAIMAATGIALTSFIMVGDASAGLWNWGCLGQFGDRQIIFNRYHLIVVPAQPSRGKLADLIAVEDLAQAGDTDRYNSTNINSGLQASMAFTQHDAPDHKLTLTQKSSKLVSDHEAKVRHCRDESTLIFRNTYSVQRDDEPVQEVTLQCEDYELSSAGGNKCY